MTRGNKKIVAIFSIFAFILAMTVCGSFSTPQIANADDDSAKETAITSSEEITSDAEISEDSSANLQASIQNNTDSDKLEFQNEDNNDGTDSASDPTSPITPFETSPIYLAVNNRSIEELEDADVAFTKEYDKTPADSFTFSLSTSSEGAGAEAYDPAGDVSVTDCSAVVNEDDFEDIINAGTYRVDIVDCVLDGVDSGDYSLFSEDDGVFASFTYVITPIELRIKLVDSHGNDVTAVDAEDCAALSDYQIVKIDGNYADGDDVYYDKTCDNSNIVQSENFGNYGANVNVNITTENTNYHITNETNPFIVYSQIISVSITRVTEINNNFDANIEAALDIKADMIEEGFLREYQDLISFLNVVSPETPRKVNEILTKVDEYMANAGNDINIKPKEAEFVYVSKATAINGTDFENAKVQIGNDAELTKLYNIKIVEALHQDVELIPGEGIPTAPRTWIITFKNAVIDGKSAKIFHWVNDMPVEVNSTVNGTSISIETNSFSPFGIAYSEQGGNNNNGENNENKQAITGVSAINFILLFIILTATAMIIRSRKDYAHKGLHR